MQSDARDNNGRAMMVGILVGLVPLAGFAAMVLHHFYIQGSFILDTGLLASLIWHSDWALSEVPAMGGRSFFATHVTPVFWLLSAISWVLPLGMAAYFAAFVGACHAMLALGIFWLLVSGFAMRRGRALAVAALLGVLFAYSGMAIAIARYPHFETLIAAAFILFAVAFSLGHTTLAALFFLIGVASREDAGFHFFAVLALLVALNVWRGIPWRAQRGWVVFAVLALLALLASVTALAVHKSLYPGNDSFARIYLGEPAFGKLTFTTLGERLAIWVFYRAYVVLPAAFACVWAWKTRNPYILLGWVAFVPWGLVHFFADSALAGFLSSYYAFPFLIALFWPLLGVYLHNPTQPPPVGRFFITLALTFIGFNGHHNPGRLTLPDAFWQPPSLAQQAATDQAIRDILAARPALGRLIVDNSVAALAPRAFSATELLGLKCLPPTILPPADTVILFTDGCDAIHLRAVSAAAGLTHVSRIPNTALHIFTRTTLPAIPTLRSVPEKEQR